MAGSGAGGKMAVFQPMPGGFRRLDAPVLHEGIGRDQTSVIGFARGDGSAAIIAGSSNYEDGQPRGSLALFRASQALAALRGRDYVIPSDVQRLCLPVLAHRVHISPQIRLRGRTPAQVVAEITDSVPVPVAE